MLNKGTICTDRKCWVRPGFEPVKFRTTQAHCRRFNLLSHELTATIVELITEQDCDMI